MSNSQSSSALSPPTKEQHSNNKLSLATLNHNSRPNSITQSRLIPAVEYPSSNTETMNVSELSMPRTQPWTSPMALASGYSSPKSKSAASSSRGGSSMDSSRLSEATRDQRSSVERAMDKAKSKLGKSSRTESLPNDDADFERQKAKEMEKFRRKAEYERLGLREKTIFGQGTRGWTSG